MLKYYYLVQFFAIWIAGVTMLLIVEDLNAQNQHFNISQLYKQNFINLRFYFFLQGVHNFRNLSEADSVEFLSYVTKLADE